MDVQSKVIKNRNSFNPKEFQSLTNNSDFYAFQAHTYKKAQLCMKFLEYDNKDDNIHKSESET